MKVLLFLTILVLVHQAQAKPAVPVTHEDIRDVILMLARVMATTEDKLKRHETRERVLGDHLRKLVLTLDKRVKSLQPVIGAARRLDTRISDVEKVVLNNDVKDNSEIEEVKLLLLDIKESFPKLIKEIKEDILREIKSAKSVPPDNSIESNSSEENGDATLSTKINTLSASIQQIQDELVKLKNEQQNTQQLNGKFNDHINKFQLLLDENENLLKKYENKFEENSNKLEVLPQDAAVPNDWNDKIIEALQRQENGIKEVFAEVKTSKDQTVDLVQNLEKKLVESIDNSKDFLESNLTSLLEKEQQTASSPAIDNINADVSIISLSLEDIQNKLSQTDFEEMRENLSKIKLHLDSGDGTVQKYDSKLAEYESKFDKFALRLDQNSKTLEAIEKQKDDIVTILDEIKAASVQGTGSNSSVDLQSTTIDLLGNLRDSIEENANNSNKLLNKIENMLATEEQMLDFSRKSSQDIIDAVETLDINAEMSFTSLTDEILALKSKYTKASSSN